MFTTISYLGIELLIDQNFNRFRSDIIQIYKICEPVDQLVWLEDLEKAMNEKSDWQLCGEDPEAYEKYVVPAFSDLINLLLPQKVSVDRIYPHDLVKIQKWR